MTEIADDGSHYNWTGSGHPVVLIHGFGMNRDMWQWQVPALSRKYRVLTYDLFGHGNSPNPPVTPSLKMFSEQITGLLDQSGIDTCAMIGFSLGGMIARRFALDHGDRLSALAILNSPHDRTPAERQAILKRVAQTAEDGPASTVEAALLRWFTDDFRENNPRIMDLIREWILANDKALYPTIYKVLAEGDEELVPGLDRITCPTLIMTGEEDYGNSVKMAENMANTIPNAELNILSGLRHMALAEAPDRVNDILVSFLGRAIIAD